MGNPYGSQRPPVVISEHKSRSNLGVLLGITPFEHLPNQFYPTLIFDSCTLCKLESLIKKALKLLGEKENNMSVLLNVLS